MHSTALSGLSRILRQLRQPKGVMRRHSKGLSVLITRSPLSLDQTDQRHLVDVQRRRHDLAGDVLRGQYCSVPKICPGPSAAPRAPACSTLLISSRSSAVPRMCAIPKSTMAAAPRSARPARSRTGSRASEILMHDPRRVGLAQRVQAVHVQRRSRSGSWPRVIHELIFEIKAVEQLHDDKGPVAMLVELPDVIDVDDVAVTGCARNSFALRRNRSSTVLTMSSVPWIPRDPELDRHLALDAHRRRL